MFFEPLQLGGDGFSTRIHGACCIPCRSMKETHIPQQELSSSPGIRVVWLTGPSSVSFSVFDDELRNGFFFFFSPDPRRKIASAPSLASLSHLTPAPSHYCCRSLSAAPKVRKQAYHPQIDDVYLDQKGREGKEDESRKSLEKERERAERCHTGYATS